MRIIAGRFRGRRLSAPRGMKIRPTADRVRESLFSIIAARVKGARVLDLFAGTGALGLEALSRGAASALFVDTGRPAIAAIRNHIKMLGVSDQCRVIRRDARDTNRLVPLLPGGKPADLIFMDPPYGRNLVPACLASLRASGLAAHDGLIIAEHHAADPWEINEASGGGIAPSAGQPAVDNGKTAETLSCLELVDQRRYGEIMISFFSFHHF